MKTKITFISIIFFLLIILSANTVRADNANSMVYGITSSSLVVYDPNENALSSYYITTTLKDFAVTPSYIFITSLDSSGYYYLNVVSTKDYQVVYTTNLSSTYSNSQKIAASNDGSYAFVLVNGNVEKIDWRNNQTTSLSLSDTSIRSIQMNPDNTILEIGGFNTGYSINPNTFTTIYTETPSAVYDRIRVSRSNILGIDLTSTPKKRIEADHLFGYLPGSTTVLNDFATPSGIDNVDGSTSQYYVVYSNNDAVFYGYNGATPLYFNSSSNNNDIAVSNDGTLLYLASSTNNQINVYSSNTSHTALGFINTPGVILKLQNGYRAVEYTATSTHSVKFTVSSLFGSVLFKNVIVTVTDSNNNILYSQSTGDDGSVVFPLQSTKLYTITAYNQTQNIDTTITLYTIDSTYVIDAGLNPIINFNGLWHSADINQSYTFNSGTGDPLQDVTLTVSQSPHTVPTSRTITATYNDDTASTGTVNFSLYKVTNNVSTYVNNHTFNLEKTGNVIINNGFESGAFAPWSNDGGASTRTISNLKAHTGLYSLNLNNSGGAGGNSVVSYAYNSGHNIDNTTYILKYSVLGWSNKNHARVDIWSIDSNSELIQGSQQIVYTNVNNNTWNDSITQYVVHTGAYGIKIYPNLDTTTANIYFDDFELTSNSAVATFNIANETQNKAASSYKVIVDANTDAYGNIERVGYASWDGTGYLLPGLGLDNKALPYAWICFGVVFLIVIIGTYLSNGIIIFIAGGAWEVMIALGWMGGSAQNFALGALVMAIGAGYVLMQKRREMV